MGITIGTKITERQTLQPHTPNAFIWMMTSGDIRECMLHSKLRSFCLARNVQSPIEIPFPTLYKNEALPPWLQSRGGGSLTFVGAHQ